MALWFSTCCLFIAYVVLPARSQTSNVTTCMSSWRWTLNSRGQTPCQVAAYLAAPCYPDGMSVNSIPQNYQYTGPMSPGTPCECNTVLYTMICACTVCQNVTLYPTWSTWTFNCSSTYKNEYPGTISSDTSVPHWAYLNISAPPYDFWDPLNALQDSRTISSDITGNGIYLPTSTPSFSSPSTSQSFFSSSQPLFTGTSSSSSTSGHNNVGAIVGGVVGGVVGIAMIAGFIFFILTRRKVVETTTPGSSQPDSSIQYTPVPSSAHSPHFLQGPQMQPQRLYNPDDPSTWPSDAANPVRFPQASVPTAMYGGHPTRRQR